MDAGELTRAQVLIPLSAMRREARLTMTPQHTLSLTRWTERVKLDSCPSESIHERVWWESMCSNVRISFPSFPFFTPPTLSTTQLFNRKWRREGPCCPLPVYSEKLPFFFNVNTHTHASENGIVLFLLKHNMQLSSSSFYSILIFLKHLSKIYFTSALNCHISFTTETKSTYSAQSDISMHFTAQ